MTIAPTFHKFLTLTLPLLNVSPKLKRPLFFTSVVLLGAAMAWLPVKITALLLGGAIFGLLLLRRPILSLYLLIPLIPFSSLLAVSLGSFKVGLMEVVLAAGVTAWLLQLSTRHNYLDGPSKNNPGQGERPFVPILLWPFLVFLGCASLSWLNTLSIGASLVETGKCVEMAVLYLLVTALLPPQHLKWVVLTVLLTGMAQAALGLYQFIFKIGPEGFLLFGGRFLRAYGTFAQPNPYAGYLGLILPLALAVAGWGTFELGFAFRRGKRHAESEDAPSNRPRFRVPLPAVKKNLMFKLFVLASLWLPPGLMLVALLASQSRAAWLGLAVAAPVSLIALSKRPGLVLALLGLTGAGIFLVTSFEPGVLQSASGRPGLPYGAVTQRLADALEIVTIADITTLEVTDANFATVERLAHWQAAREMWRDNPWLGVGFGNYAVVYPAYAVGRWLNPLGHAHNYLLNLGAEAGLAGILGYLIFWIAAFAVTWQAVRSGSGFCRAVAAGGLGILAHLHLHNLFDNLYVQGMYLHVAIILALLSVIYTCSKKEIFCQC
ncbi:MAG: O-antigen ligase family protein [Anaerolineae bacterium]|nr:O-antigen ligase family protein [Anaerolineae bacterium]